MMQILLQHVETHVGVTRGFDEGLGRAFTEEPVEGRAPLVPRDVFDAACGEVKRKRRLRRTWHSRIGHARKTGVVFM